MKNKKYTGIVVPLVTPLLTNLQLDSVALKSINDHIWESAAHPFILGTTGETASFNFEFKKNYIEQFANIVQPNQTSYAGIGANAFDESVALAHICTQYNIDAVVATLPNYYQLSPNEMYLYFEKLANAITCNLVIYNIPATTHHSIPTDIIFELSKIKNIVAIKDSERDIDRLNTCIKYFKHNDACNFLIGWAAQANYGIQNGADGIVPSTANVQCKMYKKMIDAINDGEFEIANCNQTLSDDLGALYQANKTLGQSLWALKVLMENESLSTEVVMPPLQKMDEMEKQALIKNYLNLKTKYEL